MLLTQGQRQDEGALSEFITRSADETFEVGRRLALDIRGGPVILLTGQLGAGKTVFAKGLAAGLGIDPDEVTSPSFTLINEYDGRQKLYHVDLYRLETSQTEGLGLEEIMENGSAVVVIEWADRLPSVPPGAIHVEIDYVSETERRIVIGPSGDAS
jgi:tRNA threonylcarbamoyladenosine biosynthesis protein TsaE